MRSTFSETLRLAGFHVHTAINGGSALNAFAACHHDAILVDLHMPIVDGLTFIRELRARPGGTVPPVAVVTGDYFMDDAVSDELNRLGVDIAFKPLWAEELISLTTALVNRRRTLKADASIS